MRHPLTRAALTAATLAAAITLAGCGADARSLADAAAKREKPAVPVEVATAVTATLEPSYAATSTLEAVREAALVAEVAGEVLEVLVEEGDRVTAGQVLARLDTRRATLEMKQVDSVAQRLAHDAERHELLLERRMVSREAYDRARFERDTQQAAVDLARLTVTKGALRAPYAGVITRRHVKQGQWLDTRSVAFEIADFGALETTLDVPEHLSALLRPGQPVALRADAFPGTTFAGVVDRTAPVVDRATGTVGVTVAVDSEGTPLRPGLFVRVDVRYDRIAEATLVPKTAIVSDGTASRVFVVDGETASRREVRLGVENGNQVQVLAGLDPGARVVVLGHNALKDGDRVTVLNDAAQATAAL